MSDQANDHTDQDDIDDAAPSTEIEEEELSSGDIDTESPEQAASAEEESSQSSDSPISLGEAQNRAREVAEDLLEHGFEGIIKIEAAGDDGWRTVVEVVERRAVPDTQDIIGRYEIMLDTTGNVTGYELLERYQRGDMKEEL
ncbi:gas vesicle protein [Halopenitus sp. H-Gu1]|uniref:gas vesicle protein GvpO n=1 Tax=Halopenitus sp. H-Gu1 TaxID=3242697 RepID=UPI00359CEB6A